MSYLGFLKRVRNLPFYPPLWWCPLNAQCFFWIMTFCNIPNYGSMFPSSLKIISYLPRVGLRVYDCLRVSLLLTNGRGLLLGIQLIQLSIARHKHNTHFQTINIYPEAFHICGLNLESLWEISFMISLIKSGFGNVKDPAIEDIEPSCCPFCMWSQLEYFWIYSIQ